MRMLRNKILSFILMMAVLLAGSAAAQVPAMNSVTKQSITVLPAIGPVVVPVVLPDPPVPSKVATPSAANNFRLWIYNPRNRSVALGSPGIFIAPSGGSFTFKTASSDGSLYIPVTAGSYDFDVVEPSTLSNVMTRKRYTADRGRQWNGDGERRDGECEQHLRGHRDGKHRRYRGAEAPGLADRTCH
jgi:hypothetical protein